MWMSILHVLLFAQGILYISGWGPIGHSLVARLAQSQLNSSTNNWIRNYIPYDLFGDLSTIASWPDIILYMDSNPLGYTSWQWSRELHFINIPNWVCEYVPSRDCLNDRCIEGALKNYSQRLIDDKCDYVQQQEALFFLVHFLGDIHQPLHSGFKGDFGGNSVKGYFLNGTNQTNLHTIWDVDIIDARIHRHFQSNINLYYDYLQSLMINQLSIINETYDDYQIWIKENINYVCTQIYLDDNNIKLNVSTNFTLGENYFNKNWPIIDQRLAQAGRRLVLLLDHLYQRRSTTKYSPAIQAVITVLSIQLVICILAGISVCLFKRFNARQYEVLVIQ